MTLCGTTIIQRKHNALVHACSCVSPADGRARQRAPGSRSRAAQRIPGRGGVPAPQDPHHVGRPSARERRSTSSRSPARSAPAGRRSARRSASSSRKGWRCATPNRGAIVTKLSMTDVLEIWQLREILEPAACGSLPDRIDRDALASARAGVPRAPGAEMGPEAYEAFLRADVGLARPHRRLHRERDAPARPGDAQRAHRPGPRGHLAGPLPARGGRAPRDHRRAARRATRSEAMAAMRRHLELARQSLVLLA